MLKAKNSNTRESSDIGESLYFWKSNFEGNFEKDFTGSSDVSIVDFEQANADWVVWIAEWSVLRTGTQKWLHMALNIIY